jgi:hypothetical protein
MTEHFIREAFRLLARIKRAKYIPSRVWKLYKVVKGDKGTNADGTARKCLRMRERERKPKKESK